MELKFFRGTTLANIIEMPRQMLIRLIGRRARYPILLNISIIGLGHSYKPSARLCRGDEFNNHCCTVMQNSFKNGPSRDKVRWGTCTGWALVQPKIRSASGVASTICSEYSAPQLFARIPEQHLSVFSLFHDANII